MTGSIRAALLLSCLFFAAVSGAAAQVALEDAFPGVSFLRLTDLQHDDLGRIYTAEQRGMIRVLEGGEELGVYLDIRDRVGETTLEGGIQSFAFHPDYAANGYVFVEYVAVEPRRTVIARFTRSADVPPVADAASEVILLEVEQPEFNHNGGSIAFGPDGYLYIALGDGGCCGDPFEQAQDPTTLLGSVLRIDIDTPAQGLPYGIPPDNPFAASGGPERAETYAYGFRSPWRLSIDAETGDLWLGDVGQDSYEEVSIVELGGNYGWPIMEGFHCHDPPTNCVTEGLTLPVWEYDRSGGRSVTGGYVYRGTALPDLVGHYVYGDFVSGRIWALEIDSGSGEVTNTELLDTELLLSSFGVDADGELYVLDYVGTVYRLVRGPVASEPGVQPDAAMTLQLVGPNPFRSATALTFRASGPARVAVYDVLGREVAVLYDGPGGAEQTVRLEAGALPAGTYAVRLTGPEGTLVQRLTLVR